MVYKYYFNNGFKVDEFEYKVKEKTITYRLDGECVDKLILEQIKTSSDFPKQLDAKYFDHLQGTYYSDNCYMYSLRNDEETLNKFKKFYEGQVQYNIGHLTALEEDAHKQLEKWRKIELEMKH